MTPQQCGKFLEFRVEICFNKSQITWWSSTNREIWKSLMKKILSLNLMSKRLPSCEIKRQKQEFRWVLSESQWFLMEVYVELLWISKRKQENEKIWKKSKREKCLKTSQRKWKKSWKIRKMRMFQSGKENFDLKRLGLGQNFQ